MVKGGWFLDRWVSLEVDREKQEYAVGIRARKFVLEGYNGLNSYVVEWRSQFKCVGFKASIPPMMSLFTQVHDDCGCTGTGLSYEVLAFAIVSVNDMIGPLLCSFKHV